MKTSFSSNLTFGFEVSAAYPIGHNTVGTILAGRSSIFAYAAESNPSIGQESIPSAFDPFNALPRAR